MTFTVDNGEGILTHKLKLPSTIISQVGIEDDDGNTDRVSRDVTPPDIKKMLGEACREAQKLVTKNLMPLGDTGLQFAPPPLEQSVRNLDESFAEIEEKFSQVRDIAKERKAEFQANIDAFFDKYPEGRKRRGRIKITDEYLEQRFSCKRYWLPIDLPQHIVDKLFTKEQQEDFRQQIEQEVREAFADSIRGEAENLLDNIKKAAASLAKDRVVNKKTLINAEEAFKKLEQYVPNTSLSATHLGQLQNFSGVLQEMWDARNTCEDNKKAGKEALSLAVDKARDISSQILDSLSFNFDMPEEEVEEEVQEEEKIIEPHVIDGMAFNL